METATMETEVTPSGPTSGVPLAKPLHLQRLERALRLDEVIKYAEGIFAEEISESDEDAEAENGIFTKSQASEMGIKEINGIVTTKAERKMDNKKMYNLSKVKKNRRWLKNILLSDSSDSDDDDDKPVSKEEFHDMLKLHKYKKTCHNEFLGDRELRQYMYYSSGLLSNYDKFPEHQRAILGPRKKKDEKKIKAKLKRLKKKKLAANGTPQLLKHKAQHGQVTMDQKALAALFRETANRKKHLTAKEADIKRKKIWISIGKKDIPKAHKQRSSVHNNMVSNAKKLAQLCQKEQRRAAMQSQRVCKETPQRARRLTREMMVYWKRYEKVEKEHRKRAEKEAMEQRRLDEEMREAKRQQRKLNFLITQTELYAHFMSRKLTGEGEAEQERILSKLEDNTTKRPVAVEGGTVIDVEGDDYDGDNMKQQALYNARSAYSAHEAKSKSFDGNLDVSGARRRQSSTESQAAFSLANPSSMGGQDIPQPDMFQGQLKGYQLKGMNWLANLYDCSINGILADEMGLGKTVQSIALMAHLAETQGIWGPFLVIAPASTLHNWQQECTRFVPRFKALPYWGNQSERKILRKFWSQNRQLHKEDAPFHIIITSYQLVVQDVRYFQKIKWQYMILDEAQAIKSSSSVRWKILLGFNCRNRLLLTGTPIQNSMAELWALLHFIMPTLFDSHEEFNEWFSKDIESHAEKQSGLNEEQLSRLHMILKPFMLRRIKKDVENELSDKIEVLVYCHLTTRQRLLYQAVKNKISIEDLLQSTRAHTASQVQSTTSSLMNLVMQFRKVCNHPELFEKRETQSPLTTRPTSFLLPKLLYREGLLEKVQPDKYKVLFNTLSIHHPEHIHHSLFPEQRNQSDSNCFSFLRFMDMSPGDLSHLMSAGSLVQWLTIFTVMKAAYRIYHQRMWIEERNYRTRHSPLKKSSSKYLSKDSLLLWPSWMTLYPNIRSSSVLQDLVFTSHTSKFISHTTHTYHYMAETQWHRRLRMSKMKLGSPKILGSPTRKSLPTSPTPTPLSPTRRGSHGSSLSASQSFSLGLTASGHFPPLKSPDGRPPVIRPCRPSDVPAFLQCFLPKVSGTSLDYHCSDRSAAYEHDKEKFGGSLEARNSVLFGSPQHYEQCAMARWHFFPTQPGGLLSVQPTHGWSNIQIPSKESLIMDSGKLFVLDKLLTKMKAQGHRVLIYSQMTRMIDLLEDFMVHRKHTYMRLDGSSKISDRRDMVADFQSRSDIFVFLLSTRAGGLGINLTAADTVIFYDSDWNPTVDQQAMDRAHRLGQTKQVTVYRLICKGTIEERILQRAKEKSEIQRMVISGGNFKPDQLKPKEVVSLLLDDDEIERKFLSRQEDRKKLEENNKAKDRKRKREKYAQKTGKKMKEAFGVAPPALSNDNSVMSVDGDSIFSVDSAVPSPFSEISVGSSEITHQSLGITQDDSSNDALVVVDDINDQSNQGSESLGLTFPPVLGTSLLQEELEQPKPPPRRPGRPPGKSGRGRGRPRTRPLVKKTPGRPGRPRKKAANSAAAMAGAMAGAAAASAAAYAAYGFSFKGNTNPNTTIPATASTLAAQPGVLQGQQSQPPANGT
ncbi:chromatin-remodeling ATPase INO80-like [Ptychodera flava]|uniref:chromatin-remodeling ATPase INO80-like n=1 Tax=Ptychodera flava TaxID=63121 RepID=UPI003969BC85